MSTIHPGSKGICTRCKQDVVLYPSNDQTVWKHVSSSQKHVIPKVKITSNENLLSKKESDAWVEKLGARARAIGAKNTEKPYLARPTGPTRAEESAIKPKSVQQRKRRDADRKLTYKERVEKAAAAKQAKIDKLSQLGDGLTAKEYWHPKLGYHHPKVNSTNPVVDPTTKEFVVPKTGPTGSYFGGNIPPKPGESDPVGSAQRHLETHPDHKWETAVDYASTPPTPLISPAVTDTVKGADGKEQQVFVTLPEHAYRNGMLDWAQHHKDTYDTADQYEYLAARPVDAIRQKLKNFFTPNELKNNLNSLIVKRRLKYCSGCAPTVTNNVGDKVPNPNKVFDRGPIMEIPSHPPEERRTGEGKKNVESIFSMRRKAGILPVNPNKYVHGNPNYNPNRRTGSFNTGIVEGK